MCQNDTVVCQNDLLTFIRGVCIIFILEEIMLLPDNTNEAILRVQIPSVRSGAGLKLLMRGIKMKLKTSFEIRIKIKSGKKTPLEVTGCTFCNKDKVIIIGDKEENICKLTERITQSIAGYLKMHASKREDNLFEED